MKALLAFVLFFPATAYNCIMFGLLFRKFWEWFVVKQFSLPSLSLPEACGLVMLIGFTTLEVPDRDDKVPDALKDLWHGFFMRNVILAVYWTSGAIAHSFL